jgi:hypothetical protein
MRVGDFPSRLGEGDVLRPFGRESDTCRGGVEDLAVASIVVHGDDEAVGEDEGVCRRVTACADSVHGVRERSIGFDVERLDESIWPGLVGRTAGQSPLVKSDM